jgi:hypothetical protein
MGNDQYTPTCATDCSLNTLGAFGNTDCANENNIELAEINELYLDEASTTLGVPKNPITGWVQDTDNAAALTTWRGLVNNATAAKTRLLFGIGEKPEPQETTITLHKAKLVSLCTKNSFVYTINIIDDDTYNALRKLQACKGTYHMWFATDTYFYGGLNGVRADVEKVAFVKSGGRGSNSTCVITLGWSAKADPVRDAKTW